MATVRWETTPPVAGRRLRTEQAVPAVLDPPDPPPARSSTVGHSPHGAETTRPCPRRDSGSTRTGQGSR